MHRSCLYCARSFGKNDSLELLPVGRRIAFDEIKGRLWVICGACDQWNLVPFESRLEVIEICERTFRETRTRFSTDNIGIARLKEGLELVRIGPALRPEFAAWRYGDQFTRRRRRALIGTGVAAVGSASYIVAGVATAFGLGATLLIVPAIDLSYRAFQGWKRHTAASATLPDPRTGQASAIPYSALRDATLKISDKREWSIEVPYHNEDPMLDLTQPALPSVLRTSYANFGGDDLFPALGRVLPAFNSGGGSPWRVRDAVKCLEDASDPTRLLQYVIGRPLEQVTRRSWALQDVTDDVRLALEMAAHEETERRAMAGELSLLERRWKEAEALAEIADRLVTDPTA